MNNYRKLKFSDGTTRDEHRHAMETALGGKLAFNQVVHHLNLVRNDNRLENLHVMTRVEHGRLHAKKKLTKFIARSIRASHEDSSELALKYGVTYATIWDIRTGRTWRTKKEAARATTPTPKRRRAAHSRQ